MPRADLPFTYVIGGKYWRFRRGELKAALPGKPGDPAFHSRYAELVALSEGKTPEKARGSLSWLIETYRKSAEFNALRPLTREDYDKTLTVLEREFVDPDSKQSLPFALITFRIVKRVRDEHAATPRKAHKIRQMTSRLYSWAAENDLIDPDVNPAAKIKRLKTRSHSIAVWSEEEIRLFLSHCPAWLKTAVLLALYTGQRREDIVKMAWDAFQGSIIRVRQSKTGEPLDIACHRELRAHLAAIKTSFGGPIARTAQGRPFTANSLSQAVRRQVEEIDGMPKNRSLHGLRYAAAARLDQAGCSVTEAVAVLGHRTYEMALKYMAQRRASEAALAKQEERG
jgi:integrase